jgi:short-subunit dehydrogenase
MIARGRGDFVTFASLAGWIPTPHLGAYDASKFAVVAFSEVLYHENRRSGVRFACVCPPPVDTPLLKQATSNPRIIADARPITPEQVLDAIEAALERGRFWVFPGRGSTTAWRVRRFLPGLLWRGLHGTDFTSGAPAGPVSVPPRPECSAAGAPLRRAARARACAPQGRRGAGTPFA